VVVYGLHARSALLTGCVLLAVCARAHADIFSENTEFPDRRFLTIDPNHALPVFGVRGVGVEYQARLTDATSLRFDHFTYVNQRVVHNELYRYTVTGRVQTTSIALDWRPFDGAFHSSAGFVINNADVGATGTTSGAIPISGSISQAELASFLAKPQVQQALTDYAQELQQRNIDVNTLVAGFSGASGSTRVDISGVVTASARVRWNPVAPYLGFGWSNVGVRAKGLIYSVNMGAMYIGRPKVELSVGGPLADQLRTYYSAELERYIDSERQQLQHELSRYRVLPVVSVGCWYRF
jgi:hypothetical protein